MAIINSIIKNGIKYTKNGCRLLGKERTVLSGKYKIPLDCDVSGMFYSDIVRVETDFGKAIKTITSYKSNEGKILHRTISESRNGEVVGSIMKDYVHDGTMRTVKTIKKGRGDFLISESDEFINCIGRDVSDKGATPIMTKIKFDKHFGGGGERLEHQLYETFVRGEGRTKHLETYAKRLADGHVVDTRVTGAGVDVATLSSDPYLFIRNYNLDDFANSARWIAEKNQRVEGLGGRFVIKPSKCDGYYRSIDDLVVVDTGNPFCTKSGLVDTLNHEYRHKFQNKKGSQFIQRFLNLFRSKENKVPIYKDLTYALKNKFADVVYPFTTFYKKGYMNNFLEVDARNAGKFASDVYQIASKRLAKVFGGPDKMYFVNENVLNGLIDEKVVKSVIQDAISQGNVVTIPLSLAS